MEENAALLVGVLVMTAVVAGMVLRADPWPLLLPLGVLSAVVLLALWVRAGPAGRRVPERRVLVTMAGITFLAVAQLHGRADGVCLRSVAVSVTVGGALVAAAVSWSRADWAA